MREISSGIRVVHHRRKRNTLFARHETEEEIEGKKRTRTHKQLWRRIKINSKVNEKLDGRC